MIQDSMYIYIYKQKTEESALAGIFNLSALINLHFIWPSSIELVVCIY